MYSFAALVVIVCSVSATPTSVANNTILSHEPGDISYVHGGVEAAIGAHPHIVAVTKGTTPRMIFCGGSIISSKTILTAAHCAAIAYKTGSLDSTLGALAGSNRWYAGGTFYNIVSNITHPNYNPAIKKNDIAVFFTAKDILFTDLIKPVKINYDYQGAGVTVKIAGWGKNELYEIPKALLELTVETIDDRHCVDDVAQSAIDLRIRTVPVDTDIEICTFHSRSHGTCKGDSGGPLIRVDSRELIGVVSWGFPCALGAPDVYVRLSAFKDWIQSVTV